MCFCFFEAASYYVVLSCHILLDSTWTSWSDVCNNKNVFLIICSHTLRTQGSATFMEANHFCDVFVALGLMLDLMLEPYSVLSEYSRVTDSLMKLIKDSSVGLRGYSWFDGLLRNPRSGVQTPQVLGYSPIRAALILGQAFKTPTRGWGPTGYTGKVYAGAYRAPRAYNRGFKPLRGVILRGRGLGSHMSNQGTLWRRYPGE